MRIVTTFVLQGVVGTALPFIVGHNSWSEVVILVSILGFGVCAGVLQSSLVGFSSLFPKVFNQALMTGQGVAGILAGILRISTKAAMPDKQRESAILYFGIASAFMVLCTVSYLLLLRMPFTQYHLDRNALATPTPKRKPADSWSNLDHSPTTPIDTPGGDLDSRASESPYMGPRSFPKGMSPPSAPFSSSGKSIQFELPSSASPPGSGFMLSREGRQASPANAPMTGKGDRGGLQAPLLVEEGPGASIAAGDARAASALAAAATVVPARAGHKKYGSTGGAGSGDFVVGIAHASDPSSGHGAAVLQGDPAFAEESALLAPQLSSQTGFSGPGRGRVNSNATLHNFAATPLGLKYPRGAAARTPHSGGGDGPEAEPEAILEAEGTIAYNMELMRRIWKACLAIWLCYFLTFLVFPSVVAAIPFSGSVDALQFLGSGGWWGIVLVMTFNIFDTSGRSLPALVQFLSYDTMPYFAIARLGLVLLVLAIKYNWGGSMQNDIATLVVMTFFSISNGYTTTSVMMLGPREVAQRDREVAGFVLSFFLLFGMFCGTLSALAFGS